MSRRCRARIRSDDVAVTAGHLFRARCAASASALLLLAGCSDRHGKPVAARQAPPSLKQMLVAGAAVSALPGAPPGLAQQKIDQAGITVDPDPRAACGAMILHPASLQHGAIAVLRSPTGGVVLQWVDRLPGRRAQTLIAAELADARPGCPDYYSRTDTGAVQLNHLFRVVPLPPTLGDERVAVVTRVTPIRGRPVFGVLIDLRRGTCLMRLIVYAPTRPPTPFVERLAQLAGGRLDANAAACRTAS